MSWLERSAMDARLCFVAACLRRDTPMSLLCAQHGISRKTGYKWLGRYQALGAAGLSDRCCAPLSSPAAIDGSVAETILALRRSRPSWGPRKLLARLTMDQPDQAWPAASTVGDLLKRSGLVPPRRCGRPVPHMVQDLIVPASANESWSADFKGWFLTKDGVRCEPLTVTDNYSRFLLVSQAVPRPTFDAIKPLFIGAFREHGLPASLRTDNGHPFASTRALAGLTRFSVWLLKLGIWPERIAPGRPDQNGRHERMHRTLKQEVARPRAPNLVAQQQRMDAWRLDFNTCRPHEALGQRCPASAYQRSSRCYPEVLPAWDYPPDHHRRRVNKDGYIVWQDAALYVSEALAREHVALVRRDDGDWTMRFQFFDLAVLDAQSGRVRHSRLARSGKP